jgi:hypothetical protein
LTARLDRLGPARNLNTASSMPSFRMRLMRTC